MSLYTMDIIQIEKLLEENDFKLTIKNSERIIFCMFSLDSYMQNKDSFLQFVLILNYLDKFILIVYDYFSETVEEWCRG